VGIVTGWAEPTSGSAQAATKAQNREAREVGIVFLSGFEEKRTRVGCVHPDHRVASFAAAAEK
jgi:hypothetical protein